MMLGGIWTYSLLGAWVSGMAIGLRWGSGLERLTKRDFRYHR